MCIHTTFEIKICYVIKNVFNAYVILSQHKLNGMTSKMKWLTNERIRFEMTQVVIDV